MTTQAFHEVQFPPKIAYGASGGPEFSTSIATSINGFEQRNINWHHPRGRWDISTGIKDAGDIEEILAFFRARRGKAYGFRFKDWSDYEAVYELIGVGDGEQKSFELIKEYTSGGYQYIRRILKPVETTVKIYIDGEVVLNYKLDTTTGIVTFNKPPKSGVNIRSDLEFDVPVRFDTDQIIVRASGPGRFVVDSVPLIELRQ